MLYIPAISCPTEQADWMESNPRMISASASARVFPASVDRHVTCPIAGIQSADTPEARCLEQGIPYNCRRHLLQDSDQIEKVIPTNHVRKSRPSHLRLFRRRNRPLDFLERAIGDTGKETLRSLHPRPSARPARTHKSAYNRRDSILLQDRGHWSRF